MRGIENLSALPVGVPPLRRPEISHGGCQMVALLEAGIFPQGLSHEALL